MGPDLVIAQRDQVLERIIERMRSHEHCAATSVFEWPNGGPLPVNQIQGIIRTRLRAKSE